jgi:acyl-CoA synthetase (NDP forming)
VFTDRADRLGLDLPTIDAETADALRAAGLPIFATAQNPLDVTAAVTIDAEEILPELARILADDPSVDILITQGIGLATPTYLNPDRRGLAEAHLRLAASTSKPVLAFADMAMNADPADMKLRLELGTPPVIESIDRGLKALQALDRWSRRRRQLANEYEVSTDTPGVAVPGDRRWSEATARQVLSQFGVPIAPSTLVTSADDIGKVAASYGFPLVAKICSPEIVHKSDIGGVILSIRDEEEARAAFKTLTERAREHHPYARIEGVLLGPMRPPGVELIVGVTHDSEWGLVLALGLGGVWVEVLEDVALRPLPVSRHDVSEMLSELRAAPLLDGARGTEPADRDAITDAVLAFAGAAWAMREAGLETMESNPVVVRGADVEALDVLVIFAQPAPMSA